MHIHALARFGLDPAVNCASAWKNERVRALNIHHGELKVAVERGRGNRLPLHDALVERIWRPPLIQINIGAVG